MFCEYKQLLEDIAENPQYEEYLTEHIKNVQKGYEWLKTNLPSVLSHDNYIDESAYYGELDDIIAQHDKSKYLRIPDAENYYELACEYDAYAEYFYGKDKTKEIKEGFDRAWLAHIHANPHHWQHWILQTDDEGVKLLDMPYVFLIEMICDWWSFSWKVNNLYEIFNWYEDHKKGIQLSDKTKQRVESILKALKSKIEEIED